MRIPNRLNMTSDLKESTLVDVTSLARVDTAQVMTNAAKIMAVKSVANVPSNLSATMNIHPKDFLNFEEPIDAPTASVRDVAMAFVAMVAEVASMPEDRTVSDAFAQRYLAFPTGGVGVDLSSDFPLIMLLNLIPDTAGPIWRSPSRLLWRVWENEFLNVQVADVGTAPAIEQARARAYSIVRNPDGADSQKLTAYLKWQEAYADKLREIAATAGDTAQMEAMRAELQHIETRWLTSGSRSEVEEALAVIASIGTQPPIMQFEAARQRRDNPVDRRTDLSTLIDYPKTELLPPLDSLSWAGFDHTPTSIQKLSSGVTERFPAMADSMIYESLFSGGGPAPEVLRMSGELAFVGIGRSWFKCELLRSRAWRITDGGRPFSNGADPPSGRLPAYPIGAVLARNLRVHGSALSVNATAQRAGAFRATSFIVNRHHQRRGDVNGIVHLRTEAPTRDIDDTRVVGFLFESVSKAPDPDLALFT